MSTTIGRQSVHVATTIHGPPNRAKSAGTTTSSSQARPIQPATADASTAGERPAATIPPQARSVAPTAAQTTTVAAMKAMVSLAATISS